jgi:hypothetical protein
VSTPNDSTKSPTTHTPGPWKAGEAAWFRGRAHDDTESGKRPITSTAPGARGVIANVYGRANAEFIVRACNAHDGLLEALKSLVNEATGFLAMADPNAHGQTNLNCLDLRIEAARAAIAKAEGR